MHIYIDGQRTGVNQYSSDEYFRALSLGRHVEYGKLKVLVWLCSIALWYRQSMNQIMTLNFICPLSDVLLSFDLVALSSGYRVTFSLATVSWKYWANFVRCRAENIINHRRMQSIRLYGLRREPRPRAAALHTRWRASNHGYASFFRSTVDIRIFRVAYTHAQIGSTCDFIIDSRTA
jgi:hypothetical protein